MKYSIIVPVYMQKIFKGVLEQLNKSNISQLK